MWLHKYQYLHHTSSGIPQMYLGVLGTVNPHQSASSSMVVQIQTPPATKTKKSLSALCENRCQIFMVGLNSSQSTPLYTSAVSGWVYNSRSQDNINKPRLPSIMVLHWLVFIFIAGSVHWDLSWFDGVHLRYFEYRKYPLIEKNIYKLICQLDLVFTQI